MSIDALNEHRDEAGLPGADVAQKFVRVTERRADGLVAFEFSIGWPELCVDLLLPESAFEEFCKTNRVQLLAGDNGTS